MNYPSDWKNLLSDVNSEINRFPFKSDADRYGKDDFWEEADGKGNDCEDFALAKLNRLYALGYPIEALHLATCEIPYGMNLNNPRGGHAVLVVDSPDRQYVLSNGLSMQSIQAFLAKGFNPLTIQTVGGEQEWSEWTV